MLSSKIQTLTDTVEKEFGNLNLDQFNWKLSAEQWSIGQCIDHLIVSNGKYLPELNEIVKGKHKPTFWEKYNPLCNYTGRQMLKTLGTNVLKKYKTPKLFTPTNSYISKNTIVEFKNQQDEIFKIFRELESEKYSSISITSPVASLITLKLSISNVATASF